MLLLRGRYVFSFTVSASETFPIPICDSRSFQSLHCTTFYTRNFIWTRDSPSPWASASSSFDFSSWMIFCGRESSSTRLLPTPSTQSPGKNRTVRALCRVLANKWLFSNISLNSQKSRPWGCEGSRFHLLFCRYLTAGSSLFWLLEVVICKWN